MIGKLHAFVMSSTRPIQTFLGTPDRHRQPSRIGFFKSFIQHDLIRGLILALFGQEGKVPADILSSTTTSVAFSGSGYSHSVERDCFCLPSSYSLQSNSLEIGFKKKRKTVGEY